MTGSVRDNDVGSTMGNEFGATDKRQKSIRVKRSYQNIDGTQQVEEELDDAGNKNIVNGKLGSGE